MDRRLVIDRAALLAVLALGAGAAHAAEPCRTQGAQQAKAVSLDLAEAADLLVSIPVVIKLHGLSSASLKAFPESCDRGAFQAGGRRYALTGENDDPQAPRRATSRDVKAPVLVLASVFDLSEALAAPATAGGEPRATHETYVLGSAQNDVLVVWRAYDAIPDDTRLKADMAAVLEPAATPVMRFEMKGGKVEVILPPSKP